MGRFKTGVTSVTFRKMHSLKDIVETAKKAGVDFIEWGGDIHVKSEKDAEEAKTLCDGAGIKICSYGSYYVVGSKNAAERERICMVSHALGASSVRVWLGKKDSEKTSDEEYEKLLEDARLLCDEAEKYSLKVCAECHPKTYNNDTDAFLKFKKDVQRDNFKTYFQSRYFRKEYDLDRIERTFKETENVHISYSELKREQLFRKKDSEYIDCLLKKLGEMDFDGVLIIEFTKNGDEKHFIEDIKKLKAY